MRKSRSTERILSRLFLNVNKRTRLRLALLSGMLGVAFLIGGVLTLWDIARTISQGSQRYWLPFMIMQLPWYVAADAFVLISWVGGALIATAAVLLARP